MSTLAGWISLQLSQCGRISCGILSMKTSRRSRKNPETPSTPALSVDEVEDSDDDGNTSSLEFQAQDEPADACSCTSLNMVLHPGATSRTVSFVETAHRISGYSAKVWSNPDEHTLDIGTRTTADTQPEASKPLPDVASQHTDIHNAAQQVREITLPSACDHGSEPPEGKEGQDTSCTCRQEGKSPKPMAIHKSTRRNSGPTRGLLKLWQRIWTPMGVLISVYFLLIVAWGTTLFVIMIGWTALPVLQRFQWIEICSQILTALFAITGIGFLPWRLCDTYHIILIADYARLARVREKRQSARQILGSQSFKETAEAAPTTPFERALLQQQESTVILVLTERERRHLRKSVRAIAKSKTWFRPLGTMSQRATSLKMLAIIILLNDLNSGFQCVLCGFMWCVAPPKRPLWVIAMTICGALLSTSIAGLLVAIGSWRASGPVAKNRQAFSHWKKNEFASNRVQECSCRLS